LGEIYRSATCKIIYKNYLKQGFAPAYNNSPPKLIFVKEKANLDSRLKMLGMTGQGHIIQTI